MNLKIDISQKDQLTKKFKKSKKNYEQNYS